MKIVDAVSIESLNNLGTLKPEKMVRVEDLRKELDSFRDVLQDTLAGSTVEYCIYSELLNEFDESFKSVLDEGGE